MDIALLLSLFTTILFSLASGDPQTNYLGMACSQYNATPASTFTVTLNSVLADINTSISLSNFSNFATASNPQSVTAVYALFMCRSYLSTADCKTCFSTAMKRISSCGTETGARVVYDGCMLRYEANNFFGEGTDQGSAQSCNGSANGVEGSRTEVISMVTQLATAVPKISDYAAAVESNGAYAYADCVRTLTASTCQQCLQVALGNIQSCLPRAVGRGINAGCFMRYSNARFFGANQTTDLTPYLKSGSSSTKRKAIIGGVAGGVGFLVLLVIFFLLIKRHRYSQNKRRDISDATELQGPLKFRHSDLKTATNSFSEENKLGAGGFGDVYRAKLKNGNIVAVKRLALFENNQVRANFETEVKLISNVHHRNLIRLLGCSTKGNDLLLVYEYMANSSLDKFLFGEKKGSLNWKQRINIIVGTARGLAYLHQEFHVCIIHRDIKTNNILLDDNFEAKIGDFGLARLLPNDLSHLSTRFAGTLGYTAPEYAIHGSLSEKVDTYSYGIVVLEIISGRKSNDMTLEPYAQYLLEWAWKLYESNNLISLLDKSLYIDECDTKEVEKLVKIALICTQSSATERPSMSEVVAMLMNKGDSLISEPTRPIFIDAAHQVRDDASSKRSSSSSGANANLTTTQVSGR